MSLCPSRPRLSRRNPHFSPTLPAISSTSRSLLGVLRLVALFIEPPSLPFPYSLAIFPVRSRDSHGCSALRLAAFSAFPFVSSASSMFSFPFSTPVRCSSVLAARYCRRYRDWTRYSLSGLGYFPLFVTVPSDQHVIASSDPSRLCVSVHLCSIYSEV